MSIHEELTNVYYDLVLKKSVNLSLKSKDYYLELSNQGKEFSVMTSLIPSKPGLIKTLYKEFSYFQSKNLLLDTQKNQLILTKKFHFDEMSPEIFSLALIQFHSEVLKYRLEIEALDAGASA